MTCVYIYILVATNSHPIKNGSEILFVISFATMAPYENILFDVEPRLVASAFSINAKRSVLGRHPMEHFTSLSKMACVCQKRHVSYSNRALSPSMIADKTKAIRKLRTFWANWCFTPFQLQCCYSSLYKSYNLSFDNRYNTKIEETWQRLIIIIIIIPLSFCNFAGNIDFNPI